MNNQQCKIRPEVINIGSDNPLFYSDCTKVNKCSGSCNNINNPYANLCVPNVVKNINVKVLIQYQELMKQDIQNGIKLANVNVNQM